MFAIVKTGGKQYRVGVGDQITVERLVGEVGAAISLDQVLAVGGDAPKIGTPVVAGAGDSIACAIGAGVTAPGPVSEMAGSSSCFNSVVPEPLADLDITHYPSAVDPAGYVTEVGLNTTGEALDWLAQLFYGRTARGADYALIEHAAAAAAPGAEGLLFAPVLGDGERDDPTRRGAVAGLSLRHDRRA